MNENPAPSIFCITQIEIEFVKVYPSLGIRAVMAIRTVLLNKLFNLVRQWSLSLRSRGYPHTQNDCDCRVTMGHE